MSEPLESERAHEASTQIRVEHHTGRVDHRPQGEDAALPRALDDPSRERVDGDRRRARRQGARALFVEGLAYEGRQARARDPRQLAALGDPAEQGVDRRQAAQRRGAINAHGARPRLSVARA